MWPQTGSMPEWKEGHSTAQVVFQGRLYPWVTHSVCTVTCKAYRPYTPLLQGCTAFFFFAGATFATSVGKGRLRPLILSPKAMMVLA